MDINEEVAKIISHLLYDRQEEINICTFSIICPHPHGDVIENCSKCVSVQIDTLYRKVFSEWLRKKANKKRSVGVRHRRNYLNESNYGNKFVYRKELLNSLADELEVK